MKSIDIIKSILSKLTKVFQFNIFSCFQLALIALVVIFMIPLLSSAQEDKDSLWLEIDSVNQKAIYDIPASYEKSQDILHGGELVRVLENYHVRDDSIFSVSDFIGILAEFFPDINPVVQVRNLKFRLHEYKNYVSLKGRLYQKSVFLYTSEKQIKKIVINSP